MAVPALVMEVGVNTKSSMIKDASQGKAKTIILADSSPVQWPRCHGGEKKKFLAKPYLGSIPHQRCSPYDISDYEDNCIAIYFKSV